MAQRLSRMMGIAMAIGVGSAVVGVLISYTAPSMPTGPWIVIVLSTVAVVIFVFAPERGMYARWRLRSEHEKKMGDENVLKLLYHFSERGATEAVPVSALTDARRFEAQALERSVKRLLRRDLISMSDMGLALKSSGRHEAQRVVRLHRLWELYLSTRMNLASDHVHHDAEAIEHIITPELEKALIEELGYPTVDPHLSEIPGIRKRPSP